LGARVVDIRTGARDRDWRAVERAASGQPLAVHSKLDATDRTPLGQEVERTAAASHRASHRQREELVFVERLGRTLDPLAT
jgi:hypothetical protein